MPAGGQKGTENPGRGVREQSLHLPHQEHDRRRPQWGCQGGIDTAPSEHTVGRR